MLFMLQIYPITTLDQCQEVGRLEQLVWQASDREVIPAHVLITLAKNGGLVLGAWDGTQLVGVVVGWTGHSADKEIKHVSHIAAVHPHYQNQQIGYQLKQAQRLWVLAQGINVITWTFDPLESRNAYLNLGKLGGTAAIYWRDLYGEVEDGLNAGIPSDRFLLEWQLDSADVMAKQSGTRPPFPAHLPVVNPSKENRPTMHELNFSAPAFLVEIPRHYQAMKSADLPLACAWRWHTRDLFEHAFAQGYRAHDFWVHQEKSYYQLSRAPSNDTHP